MLALGAGVYAGQRWHNSLLRMTRRTLPPTLALLALAILGLTAGPAVLERYRLSRLDQPASGAPSVLLIILDTVRAQNLGLFGYQRPTTPRLEAYSRSGVVFLNAIAPAPWTLPTHASILTGQPPAALSTSWRIPLDHAYPTLAEMLSARGYATGGFVANLLYTSRSTGLNRGFLHYEDYDLSWSLWAHSAWLTEQIGTWLARQLQNRPMLVRKRAPQVSSELLRWVSSLRGRPFFAFLNYFDAHWPYEGRSAFLDRLGDQPRDSMLNAAVVQAPMSGTTLPPLTTTTPRSPSSTSRWVRCWTR